MFFLVDCNSFSGEEDISKLQPDLLLYKASAAHNLPVMLEALALGADKNWTNPDDRNRSPIHASVLSVSSNRCWSLRGGGLNKKHHLMIFIDQNVSTFQISRGRQPVSPLQCASVIYINYFLFLHKNNYYRDLLCHVLSLF